MPRSPDSGVPSASEAGPTGGRPPNRRGSSGPSLVSGTSTEFLGRKPLPRAVRYRPVVFLMGPSGVGKSQVAAALLGPGHMHLGDGELRDSLVRQVRRRTWPEELVEAERLIIDGPCFLRRRPAVTRVLGELLAERTASGRRTVVVEGPDRSPLTALMNTVEPEQRATLVLRFPVGRGRKRYAMRLCDELGIDRAHAAKVAALDPWTYDAVQAVLEAVRAELEPPPGRPSRRRRRSRKKR